MKSLKDIKFKELILHNFSLKILAVIIAIVLWIVIVNIDNPSKRQTISGIQVNVLNGSVLVDKGYTYQIESGSVISIVVKAPQSVADELRASDFYAYADISERLTDSDRVQIHVECTKDDVAEQVDIVSMKTEYVQLSIDNKIDKELPIEVVITGTPANGYVVGDYSVSPTTVRISGAEAAVNKIVGAKLVYSVDSMTENVDDMVKPIFYDADNKEVSTDKLEINRIGIRLKISILPTKWVPVNFILSGTPADGYALIDKTANINSVNVAATRELLASITSIDIPAGVVDVSGIEANKVYEVPLATYLPNGYRIVSSITSLKVTAYIEKFSDVTINVPFENIIVNGRNERYEYEILGEDDAEVLSVGVTGIESELVNVTADELGASVDVSMRNPGIFTIKVSFDESDIYEVKGNYYIKIKISDPNEETTPAEDESSEESTTEDTTEAEDSTKIEPRTGEGE